MNQQPEASSIAILLYLVAGLAFLIGVLAFCSAAQENMKGADIVFAGESLVSGFFFLALGSLVNAACKIECHLRVMRGSAESAASPATAAAARAPQEVI
jgi:hypothetical protein